MAFVKMGVTPELASSHFLVQRMGFGKASGMCLSARLYSGREAFEMGPGRPPRPRDKLNAARIAHQGGVASRLEEAVDHGSS